MFDKDFLRSFHLVLSLLIVLPVLGIQKLWIAILDLFIVLEESLVIDQVFERLSDFLDIDVFVSADHVINVTFSLDCVLVEKFERQYLILA